METTIEKKGWARCVFSIIAAILLLFGGLFLFGYYLNVIPQMSGITIGQILLYSLLADIPLLAGGIWLGAMYKRDKRRRSPNHAMMGGLFLGLALIIVGLFLLSFGLGIVPIGWKRVFISWQMLLIAIGVMEIFKHHFVWGVVLAGVGSFFIIPRMIEAYPASWAIGENFISTYWPMLLIIFGIIIVLAMIIRPKKRCKRSSSGRGNFHDKHYNAPIAAESNEGVINYSLLFTAAEHVFLEPEFRGGTIDTVLAGMNLDLRRSQLPEGATHLKVHTVLGGVNIKVPENWNIEVNNESVLGGLTDKRINVSTGDPGRKLIITASCVLGGIELEN